MKYLSLFYLAIILLSISCTRDVIVPDAINNCDESVIYFERDLMPVIISSCATAGCHAEVDPEHGIKLNNLSNIYKHVKPGNPEESKLYSDLAGVIDPNDEDAMPPLPNTPLTSQQIDDIYTWIKDGAVLYECDVDCVVEEVTFNLTVTPLIQKYCIGCHSSNNASGGVRLDSYNKIKSYAQNGELMGTINNDPGYTAMPPGGVSLTSCEVLELQKWIDEGALDN